MQRYARTFLLIAREIFAAGRWRAVIVAPLGLLAAATRLVTFGLLIEYLGSFSSEDGAAAFDIQFSPIELEATDTIAWTVLVLAVALLAALLAYAQARVQLEVGRRLAVRVRRQHLMAVGESEKARQLRIDIPTFIRSAPSVLSMLSPAVQVIAFGAVMVSMRPPLTALLFIVAALFVAPLGLLGVRIVANAEEREGAGERVRRAQEPLMNLLLSGSFPREITLPAIDDHLADAAVRSQLGSTVMIRANQEQAKALSGVVWAAVLAAIVIVAGVTEVPGDVSLGPLIAYAVVARFFFAAVAGLISNISQFNRFLPNFRRYAELHELLDELEWTASPPPTIDHAGEVWLVDHRKAVPVALMSSWIRTIDLVAPDSPIVAVRPLDDLPEISAEQLCRNAATVTSGPLREMFDSLRIRNELESGVAEGNLRNELSQSVRTLIAFSPVVLRETGAIVVCAHEMVAGLTNRQRHALIDRLAQHVLVLVGSAPNRKVPYIDRILDAPEVPTRATGFLDATDDMEEDS